MARKLKVEYPGATHHMMNRGDRQEAIFIFKDDEDRVRFLATPGEAFAIGTLRRVVPCDRPRQCAARRFREDQNRRRFLELREEMVGLSCVRLQALVLMSNHYHRLLEPTAARLNCPTRSIG